MTDGQNPASAELRFQRELGAAFRQAGGVFRARLDEALAPLNATTPQFAALEAVGAHPGISSADLSRLLQVTPPTIAVIVANLKRAGWIRAERGAARRRVLQLRLTEAGAAVLADGRAAVDSLESRLAAGLGAAELETVRRWLDAVRRI